MPMGWDTKIKTELGSSTSSTKDSKGENDGVGIRLASRANCCAFRFGIDTSMEALCGSSSTNSENTNNNNNQTTTVYRPPGIGAVELTANLRSRFFALPYGDQTLSLSKAVFDFVGGYPDQCLMEDYELVGLLRRRASVMAKLTSTNGTAVAIGSDGVLEQERLGIVPGDPALCSPRRWQKFGVLYVTYTNSKLVRTYGKDEMREDCGPDGLYRRYYGRDPPKRSEDVSPWEKDLKVLLLSSS